MLKFLSTAEQKYSGSELQDIQNTLQEVNNIKTTSQIYNLDYAICVAEEVVENGLDYKCVIAALIFPFFKQGLYPIDNYNDEEIKSLLNTLLALEKIKVNTHQAQLSAIKNIFIALSKDLRTIILKLCLEVSRLHFFEYYSIVEKDEIMIAFRDIYSPISSMLGISDIKDEFETAIFKFYQPEFYDNLNHAVQTYINEGQEVINKAIQKIKTELTPQFPSIKVYGRQKKLYSIAKKLMMKNIGVDTIIKTYDGSLAENNTDFNRTKLSQIVDILAIRILVNTVEDCYNVLGKVYSLFKPLGNFKDYIAHPKENGYQSLHTIVLLDDDRPMEIQIRTYDMHTFAEYGYAAHWAYKQKHKVDDNDEKINYIRHVMDSFKDKSSEELMQVMKSDVYSDEIFVQSPMGKVIELKEGSTPVDFAYSIHSNIGNTCVGAKINGRMVPLTTQLCNGDVVEIITSPNAKGPSRDWLKIVKTTQAKKKINDFFKHEMKDENIKKGKSILENQAKIKSVNLADLMQQKYLDEVFDRYSFTSIDDMYASIGFGSISSLQILNKLIACLQEDKGITKEIEVKSYKNYKPSSGINIKGYSDMLVKYARCCNPLPGDDIVGYISRGSGITIHRRDCPCLSEYEFERLIECNWNTDDSTEFVGSLTIVTQNKSGVLSSISKKINDMNINISGISSKNNPNGTSTIYLQVNVNDRKELDELISRLNQFSFVLNISR